MGNTSSKSDSDRKAAYGYGPNRAPSPNSHTRRHDGSEHRHAKKHDHSERRDARRNDKDEEHRRATHRRPRTPKLEEQSDSPRNTLRPPKDSDGRDRARTGKDGLDVPLRASAHSSRNSSRNSSKVDTSERPSTPETRTRGRRRRHGESRRRHRIDEAVDNPQDNEVENPQDNRVENPQDNQVEEGDPARLWIMAMNRVKISKPTLWQQYNTRITEQLHDPEKTVGDSVANALEEARTNYKDTRWGFNRKDGTRVVFQDVVQDILQNISSVSAFGAAAASCDPTKAAAVGWAGIQYFVKAGLDNADIRRIVLDDQRSIAIIIHHCAVTENTYLSGGAASTSGSRQNLQDAIVNLYEKILLYNMQGLSYLEKPAIKSGFAILEGSESRALKNTVDDIKAGFELVDRSVQNNQGDALNTITDVLAAMGEQLQALIKKSSPEDEQDIAMEELYLLGSDGSMSGIHCPPDDKMKDIPAQPQWLQLLYFFKNCFIDQPDYVNGELQEERQADPRLNRRKVDSLTMWRILSTSIKPVLSASFYIPGARLYLAGGQDNYLAVDYMGHDTLYIPSLETARLVLRNAQSTPEGALCGEVYQNTSNYELTMPYLLCMSNFPDKNRLYTKNQLSWAKNCLLWLKDVVRRVRVDESEPPRTEINALCFHRGPDWFKAELMRGMLIETAWYSCHKAMITYFEQNSEPFEVEDTVKMLIKADNGDVDGFVDDVQQSRMPQFGGREKSLLLALLINLSWNLQRAIEIPETFQKLLEKKYCIV